MTAIFCFTPLKFNSKSHWKMMVRRLLSFGDGLVPGAMLNFQGVLSSCWKLKSKSNVTMQ